MKIAKVFKHGNSQAVRLPKEFRLDSDEVVIKRSGDVILLIPKRYSYDALLSLVSGFKGPIARRQPRRQQRRHW